MRAFAYDKPTDVAHAAEILSTDPEAVVLAGGTNLVDLMKLGVARPARLVDITGLGMDTIEHRPNGGMFIGATTSNADVAGDPEVRRRFPLLSQAILAGASGQLRHSATTAGNLLQRTRCVFFQDTTKPCNKRLPGSGCGARDGLHRDLGIIGTSESCVATHPSDMAVALAALDARVVVRRAAGGTTRYALDELYLLPGQTPDREHALERGDLITGVEVPPPPAGAAMRYRKVRDRASYAFAVISVAAVLRMEEDVVGDVRVALGAVAPRPWRTYGLETALAGHRLSPNLLLRASREELRSAHPLPQNAFKVELAVDVIAAVLRELDGVCR